MFFGHQFWLVPEEGGPYTLWYYRTPIIVDKYNVLVCVRLQTSKIPGTLKIKFPEICSEIVTLTIIVDATSVYIR